MGLFHPQATGSASFNIGSTKVMAAVYGPHEVRSSQRKHQSQDKMIINCEYSSATFSSIERKSSTKADRKSMEISANLRAVMEHIIIPDIFPGSQIDVYVELLQDDGGSYAACINAATLALVDAGIPIRDYAVAVTATMTHSVCMIDINSQERGQCAELTIGILAQTNEIIVLELSNLLQNFYLSDVLDEGIKGCAQIYKTLEEAVRQKFNKMEQSLV
jgi:exosome complex component RRP41